MYIEVRFGESEEAVEDQAGAHEDGASGYAIWIVVRWWLHRGF